ncbi:MAG: hypothetical protein IIU36_00315 [Firmicutes bacterium]|nr:hypothetical protein [Bacillota bacterium]
MDNKKIKKYIIIIVVILCLVCLCYHIISTTDSETYLSDDVMFGSFVYLDEGIRNHPADFIVSVDVPPSIDDEFKSIAIENGVDINSESWIYSFGEKRMYSAEYKDGVVYAFDGSELIGTFNATYNSLLWKKYNVHYFVNWHGEERELLKTMQAYVYP